MSGASNIQRRRRAPPPPPEEDEIQVAEEPRNQQYGPYGSVNLQFDSEELARMGIEQQSVWDMLSIVFPLSFTGWTDSPYDNVINVLAWVLPMIAGFSFGWRGLVLIGFQVYSLRRIQESRGDAPIPMVWAVPWITSWLHSRHIGLLNVGRIMTFDDACSLEAVVSFFSSVLYLVLPEPYAGRTPLVATLFIIAHLAYSQGTIAGPLVLFSVTLLCAAITWTRRRRQWVFEE